MLKTKSLDKKNGKHSFTTPDFGELEKMSSYEKTVRGKLNLKGGLKLKYVTLVSSLS